MRKGLILGLLVAVLAIAAIAALLYRPATLIGASAKSLAYSLRGAADSDKTGACKGENDKFDCAVFDPKSGDQVPYRVIVHDYGCWDAMISRRPGGGDLPEVFSGCITIVDLVRLDD